jgi:Ni,Fe-hydrogenase maturation factor
VILLLSLGNGSRGDDGVGLALGRALVHRLPPGTSRSHAACRSPSL